MDIGILVTQMIELFIIMLIGYIVYKLKIVDNDFVKKFTRLVLDVTLPAMILASVLNLTERQPVSDVLICLGCAVALIFVILPAIGGGLAFIVRADARTRGLYTFMNTFSNVGFMGFPVVKAICGDVGLFYAAIFNLVFNIAVYSLGVWLINRGRRHEVKFNAKMLISPGTVVAVLSLLVYFLNVHPPEVITGTVTTIGEITSPAAMLIIGFSLARIDIKNVFNEWRLYPWTLMKQIGVPLLLWLPLTWVIKNPMLLTVTYLMTAMPVANTAVLFATTYEVNADLAAKGVFITTLFSLITVPLTVILVM